MTRIGVLAAVEALLLAFTAPAHVQEARRLDMLDVGALVQQLHDVPLAMPAATPSDGIERPVEVRRREICDRLAARSPASVRALALGLQDPDVAFRRNVALAQNVLGGGWWSSRGNTRNVDLGPVLPELPRALDDANSTVRA